MREVEMPQKHERRIYFDGLEKFFDHVVWSLWEKKESTRKWDEISGNRGESI